ncbi:DUF4183 domain-containing protein [Caproiciproducens sp. CPB-2]|uniref:DUF4183 domain-containing protein n=1 Tax=unclassified Caproiciproducens TaxID=2643836 RepID=UPI0023DB8C84|nr:DUF4183 domain-containing protein [Caproiciproducens sp. CPB-2]MDF1494781.1 DUF4183 domain-containing protein [Caproiciproducens sp. CPB-2]
MALQLFKLVMAGATETVPTQSRYFGTTSADITITSTVSYTIAPGSLVDDDGATVAEITTATDNNGFYMLFINGTLTQSGMYTVDSAAGITIGNAALTAPVTILASSPITLGVTNFAPVTSITG